MKFINKILLRWRNYENSRVLPSIRSQDGKLIEDQNTILELSGRLQELQNEVNCLNDSKDFQDAESVRSGNSHVTSRPVSFPPHPIPEGMLRSSYAKDQVTRTSWSSCARSARATAQKQMQTCYKLDHHSPTDLPFLILV